MQNSRQDSAGAVAGFGSAAWRVDTGLDVGARSK